MSKELLDPNLWNLEIVFKNIYNVPVYQRPYSWDKEQVNVLLSDIFENYENENNKEGYYTGNIIIYDRNLKLNGYITSYDIIDGQQRLTTFSLILLVTYSLILSKNKKANEQSTVIKLKESLWKSINRECKKEYKTVQINSIEKDCYNSIFDKGFDAPQELYEYVNKYKCIGIFDERIISNVNEIFDVLNEKFSSKDVNEILDFADYLMNFIKFISIEAKCKQKEVFSMFESINSKGKKLEVIDLIKTYIFSKLDENSYDSYSKKWGNLINSTEDKLYDYLYTYIRSYVSYYRQNINIDIFKSISSRDLPNIYCVSSEQEALKRLIDDLTNNIEYYKMLSDINKVYDKVKSSKFRYFFNIFIKAGYQHPKPLFFRSLIEYNDGKLSKNDLEEIVIDTVTFMIKFLSISDRDSKDVINVFKEIMTEIIEKKVVNKESIINKIESQLILKGINNISLKELLNNLDCYSAKRDISIPLIALYECTEITEKNGKKQYKTSYDQAFELVNDFSKLYSLDHLLVRTPELNDVHFKYYKDENNTLVLKQDNDFPEGLVQSGMDYEIFTKSILNKIGNLRIYYKDKNSSRQNDGISLPENPDFYNYKNIKERGKEIADFIFDVCLPNYKIEVKDIESHSTNTRKKDLLNMADFFEMGILSKGDKVYLTTKPEKSQATIIDSKFVDYNGEKLTINEWGCKVNGWKSIRVYKYMAKVGENETLQDIREKNKNDISYEE